MDTIIRKQLLYKSDVEYANYSINHIQGCAHGCKYPCYALLMKKRFGQTTDKEWIKPQLVANAIELLDKEIPKLKDKIKEVHLCFTSDPFMYGFKEVSDMSVEILKKLNANGIPCTTLTKGIYPAEQIRKATEINNTRFGITLVTLNEGFREKYEPGAASIRFRIAALKKLHKLGYTTWVSIEPYPTPNIISQSLTEILEAISFVDKIVFGRLNYNSLVSKYKGYREFFNEQTASVISFCNKHGIEYYIKEGTVTE